MKAPMLVLFTLILIPMFSSASPETVRSAYLGCVQYLKMTPEMQKKVSLRSGVNVALTLQSCRVLVREGLARDLALDAQYERANSQRSEGPDRIEGQDTVTCFVDNQCTTVFSRGLAPSSCPSGSSFTFDYDQSACHRN